MPVVLVGDIERGGVIAALVGTWELLEAAERRHLKGYIVNKFRGDPALFEAAHGVILARTGMRSFGVVPWFEAARRLPAEDFLGLEDGPRPAPAAAPSGSWCRGCRGWRISTISTRSRPSLTLFSGLCRPGKRCRGMRTW